MSCLFGNLREIIGQCNGHALALHMYMHMYAYNIYLCTCLLQCVLGYLNLDYPTPRLSERLKLVTVHAQSINFKMAAIIFVGVCYGLFTVEQKGKNAALSVECKLFFFTMEIT